MEQRDTDSKHTRNENGNAIIVEGTMALPRGFLEQLARYFRLRMREGNGSMV